MGTTTSKRKRDYRAEYQRRIKRGLARGLTRSQSRGHPTVNEQSIRAPRPIPDKQLQISLKALRSGSTLREVAKQIRVSPERFRNQAMALGAIRKHGGRWIVKKSLPRQMLVYTDGQSLRITISQFREASKLGRYMAGVGRFLSTNDATHLEEFVDKSVKDRKGSRYTLETNPNALYRIAATGSEAFEQIYRIVV